MAQKKNIELEDELSRPLPNWQVQVRFKSYPKNPWGFQQNPKKP